MRLERAGAARERGEETTRELLALRARQLERAPRESIESGRDRGIVGRLTPCEDDR